MSWQAFPSIILTDYKLTKYHPMRKLKNFLLFTFISFSFWGTAQSYDSQDVVLATMAPRAKLQKVQYSFDVSLLEQMSDKNTEKEINGASVSIYNNTTQKTELNKKYISKSNFDFTFKEGNHYTLTIQKDGFKTKKLEAFVKTEGCLLCFEGLNMVKNNVSDALSSNNKTGVILANVKLVRE